MSKLQKIALGSLLLAVAVMVFMEASGPKPLNWFPSYAEQDKIPYGTYILHELMEEHLDPHFQNKEEPPYLEVKDSSMQGVYFFVNNHLPFDDTEMESLLDWVSSGNTLFLSADYFNQNLLDTLGLEMKTITLLDQLATEPVLNLTNKHLKHENYWHYSRDATLRYFSKIDTASQTVLGHTQAMEKNATFEEPKSNFLEIPFEDGTIYMHSFPVAFTNYFLVQEDLFSYTKNTLSYLPAETTIFWDSHHKTGKAVSISPLQFLFQNTYLKWAYYFLLIAALLFVLFEGKRKQRSIPIIPPISNKSLEYTQTIAGMYLEKKEIHELAKKQIHLFLEHIRTHLRIPTENKDQQFIRQVAAKSGNTEKETKALFHYIQKILNQQETTKDELKTLYTKIDTFKNNTHGGNRTTG